MCRSCNVIAQANGHRSQYVLGLETLAVFPEGCLDADAAPCDHALRTITALIEHETADKCLKHQQRQWSPAQRSAAEAVQAAVVSQLLDETNDYPTPITSFLSKNVGPQYSYLPEKLGASPLEFLSPALSEQDLLLEKVKDVITHYLDEWNRQQQQKQAAIIAEGIARQINKALNVGGALNYQMPCYPNFLVDAAADARAYNVQRNDVVYQMAVPQVVQAPVQDTGPDLLSRQTTETSVGMSDAEILTLLSFLLEDPIFSGGQQFPAPPPCKIGLAEPATTLEKDMTELTVGYRPEPSLQFESQLPLNEKSVGAPFHDVAVQPPTMVEVVVPKLKATIRDPLDEEIHSCSTTSTRSGSKMSPPSTQTFVQPRPSPPAVKVDFSEFKNLASLQTVLRNKEDAKRIALKKRNKGVPTHMVHQVLPAAPFTTANIDSASIYIADGMLKCRPPQISTENNFTLHNEDASKNNSNAAAATSRRRRPDAELIEMVATRSREQVIALLLQECEGKGVLKDVDVLFTSFMREQSHRLSTPELKQLLYLILVSSRQQIFSWIAGQTELPQRKLLSAGIFGDGNARCKESAPIHYHKLSKSGYVQHSAAGTRGNEKHKSADCKMALSDFVAGQALLAFLNADHPHLRRMNVKNAACMLPAQSLPRRSRKRDIGSSRRRCASL